MPPLQAAFTARRSSVPGWAGIGTVAIVRARERWLMQNAATTSAPILDQVQTDFWCKDLTCRTKDLWSLLRAAVHQFCVVA